jgi:hypothetical protein
MTTFKALGTARRNLWYRIDRYLAELEKRTSQPGRREGDHLLRGAAPFFTRDSFRPLTHP